MRRLVTLRAHARAMARGAVWVATGILLSCASPGSPPGGPEDALAPKLLKISPDSNAIGVKPKVVIYQFDEVINERSAATGGGFGGASGDYAASGSGSGGSSRSASTLTSLFLISPISGDVDVSWHRSRIEVRPRKGWRANTTYVVRMLPGIADLRSNRDTVGRTFVFSTGKEIAMGLVSGIAFDWLTGKPASGAWVEARPVGDTTLAYVTVADSIGKFRITHVPAGAFKLRAIIDQNHNRAIDPREAYDSATVTVRDSVSREMLAFPHDTIGAGIATVEMKDSVTLRVQFDRAIDIGQRLTPATFTLKAHDSTVVAITTVMTNIESARQDSIKAAAAADSSRRAAEASRDSARKADSAKTAARPKGPTPQVPVRRPPPTRADTGKKPEPPPKPSKASPVLEYVLKIAAPLKPATAYRLHADSVRNLLGRARTSERQFTTPKPPPPPDTTKTKRPTNARADSLRRRPGARPAAPPRADTTRRDTTARDTVRRDSTRRDSTVRDTSRARVDTLKIFKR